jgi:hypothetical protein
LPVSGSQADLIAQRLLGTWEPGDPFFDTTNKQALLNVAASGLPTFLGQMFCGKVQYSFADDGGAVSTITPKNTITLPVGVIVYGGLLEVITNPTSAGAATIAVQAQAANDIITATAFDDALFASAGTAKAIIPVCTAATSKLIATTAKAVKVVIGGAALTAGKFNIHLLCFYGG